MNHIYGNLWFIPPFTTAWLTLLACLVLDLDLFPWTFWIPSPNPTWRFCPRPNVGNSCGFHIPRNAWTTSNMIKQQNYIQLTSTYNNTQSIQIHCMTCAYNDTPIQLGPRHHPPTRTSDAPLPSEGMYDLQMHAVLLADSVNSMLESSGWCWSSTELSGIYNGHHISNMEYGNIPLTMEISHLPWKYPT